MPMNTRFHLAAGNRPKGPISGGIQVLVGPRKRVLEQMWRSVFRLNSKKLASRGFWMGPLRVKFFTFLVDALPWKVKFLTHRESTPSFAKG